MRDAERRFARLAEALSRRRLAEVELYLKRGRSHRVELGASGPRGRRLEVRTEEEGWAVRAGGPRGSLFSCGTREPDPGGSWPAARGEPLQLPAPHEEVSELAPDQVDAPLMVESEAIDRLQRFETALRRELSDARVLGAVLDDGRSEARLLSSRGVDCFQRRRAAALYIEVIAGGTRRSAQLAAPSAAGFDVEALGRQFATRLSIGREGAPAEGGSGEMVLAPAVAIRLLAGLLPLLVGGDGWRIARQLKNRRGWVGSDRLTIVDDGGLAGGILAAASDGEGVPTREVVLIEAGEYRQPLLSWREAAPARGESSGCMLRPSWRQPPEPGPTHLYIRPDSRIAPADMISSVAGGYYWLDALSAGRFDPAGDRFELPVYGFRLERGKASRPVSAARIRGSIGKLLRGIRGVGRDCAFSPHGYLFGAPTLLVEGLELDATAPPG